MQVPQRTLLPSLCLAAAVSATLPGVAHARPKVLSLPVGSLARDYVVGKNQVLRITKKAVLGKHRVTVNGGSLEVVGRVDVPRGAVLTVYGGELEGQGDVYIHPGAKLRLTGNHKKSLAGVQIHNAGIVEWGGKGRIYCGNDTVVNNTGIMYLSNGAKKKAHYPATTAKFENNGSIIDISVGKGATLHGRLINNGILKLNDKKPPFTPIVGVSPTPSLIQITGGMFGTPTSTFQTTINATNYGQLNIPGSCALGGTFKYVLSPTTLNPGTQDYDVILAGAIGAGDFAAFTSTPTPFRFTHQKVLTTTPKKYQLVNFT